MYHFTGLRMEHCLRLAIALIRATRKEKLCEKWKFNLLREVCRSSYLGYSLLTFRQEADTRCCRPVASRQHRGCIIPQAVTHSLVLLQNNFPKHVELTGIINKPLLLHLVGCLYYLYFIKICNTIYYLTPRCIIPGC